MSVNLSPTTWATGIDDTLAVADVYTQKSATVPINATKTINEINQQVYAAMLGAKRLSDAVRNPTKNLALTAASIINGIIAQIPYLNANYGKLGRDLQALLTSISSITNNQAYQQLLIGSTVNKSPFAKRYVTVKSENYANITAITAMLNSLSENPTEFSVVDQNAQIVLMTNLLSVSSGLGIPGAYTTAIGSISDPYAREVITANVLASVVSTSNVGMLYDIAKGPCANTALSYYPNFIKEFLGAYKLQAQAYESRRREAQALSSVLTLLSPNWYTASKAGQTTVYNATVMSAATADLLKLIEDASKDTPRTPFLAVSAPEVVANIPEETSPHATRLVINPSATTTKTVDRYQNGKTVEYITDHSTTPPTITRVTSVPTAVTQSTTQGFWNTFDNSAIEDPMELMYVVTDACAQSKAAMVDPAPMDADAVDAIRAYFPYLPSDGLQSSMDTYGA